jgi:hypothetical protein
MIAALVSSGERRLLTVAVGAEETDILDPIIRIIAVDVIQDQNQRFASPYRKRIALITAIDQDAFADESSLELGRGSHWRIGDKDFGEWSFGRPRMCLPFEMALACEMRRVQSEPSEVGVHAFVVGPGW